MPAEESKTHPLTCLAERARAQRRASESKHLRSFYYLKRSRLAHEPQGVTVGVLHIHLPRSPCLVNRSGIDLHSPSDQLGMQSVHILDLEVHHPTRYPVTGKR